MYPSFLLMSILVTLLLLPFENARVVFFGMPIYLVEIGVMASVVAPLFAWKRKGGMAQFIEATPKTFGAPLPVPIRWGIAFLLLGILSSTLVALSNHSICPLSHEGFLRALGIVKSWFLVPILFGYIIFYASRVYFSREKLMFHFMVSFLPFGMFSLLMWLFGSGMTYDGRFEGIFNSPNALAMYLTPAVILSWYFFRTPTFSLPQAGRHSSSHILHPIFFVLLLSLLFLTYSYSAWIAVFVALFFFETMKTGVSFKKFAARSCLFFVLVGALALSQWNDPRFEHFFDPDSRSSFASRVMIWKSAGRMIVDSPIFGIGPGNFQSCYLAYQKYFPPYLEWSVPEPHNIFLAFWLGGGIIGLLGCGFLVFWWFRNVFQGMKKEGGQLLLALAAIMIAMLIHGLVDTPYWRMSLSYIFWWMFYMGIQEKNGK